MVKKGVRDELVHQTEERGPNAGDVLVPNVVVRRAVAQIMDVFRLLFDKDVFHVGVLPAQSENVEAREEGLNLKVVIFYFLDYESFLLQEAALDGQLLLFGRVGHFLLCLTSVTVA